MVVVGLSLLAALSYGLGDFVGGVASKRASPWAVALVTQIVSTVVILLVAVVDGGDPTAADLWWAVAAGLFNGVGTAFLYRGLSAGRMGVVAPISGVGAAALPVLVGLAVGERPALLVWVGIAAALPGIYLVAQEPAGTSTGTASGGSGFVDGVLAGLGFGGLFACLAQIPDEAGFLPLALNQVVAAGTVVAVALALRQQWVPRQPAAAIGAVSGALGAVATGSFLLATQTGYLTVAAVITSLYPAVTVVLAAAVLRERVHRSQAWGLVLCLSAVAMVAAG